MKLLLIISLAAAAHGSAFLEDGKEYVYDDIGVQTAGTMDYVGHVSGIKYQGELRMQVAGNKINVQYTSIKTSQYNGKGSPTDETIWENTVFTPVPMNFQFSIEYDNGKAVALVMPSDLTISQQNMVRAFASNWQIQTGFGPHDHFAESEEKLLHGDCNVHYGINEGLITKSVSHFKSCRNRKYRLIDNWGGWRCDGEYFMEAFMKDGRLEQGRESPEPLYSNSDTFFVVERKGDRYQVNHMSSGGALVAQFFEEEGVSHFIFTNRTMTLKDVKASDGSISPSGSRTEDLAYQFADSQYQWNTDRDLKAREPFFTTGPLFEDDQAGLQQKALMMFEQLYNNFDIHDQEPASIQKLHKYGVQMILPIMITMDYNSLKAVFDQLSADGSKKGVAKRNFFTEMVGTAGTTAGAMFVKDAITNNLFDNDRDATRALMAVPFHIRRPNVQLVNEFASLRGNVEGRFLTRSVPLALAHLVRMTCQRAGKMLSQERRTCITELSDKYADEYFNIFTSSSDEEERKMALGFLYNLRWGKISDLLKPVVYGEMAGVSDNLRGSAIMAAVWGTYVKQETISYMFPIFANINNNHELRIYALEYMFTAQNLDATTVSTVMTLLYAEKDYEVLNYAFTLFEKYATTINPCLSKKAHIVGYFLKFMKQSGMHEMSYGFGVSKTYKREFQKKKYGYGGFYHYYAIGSHRSTTPLKIIMSIGQTVYQSYQSDLFTVSLRIEGLAKALVRKFKKIPENSWKIDDLRNLLTGMGVPTKPNQEVKVEIGIALKNTIVFYTLYDESDTRPGGKLESFLKELKGSTSNEYSINHQRAVSVGSALYEQPSELGFPAAYFTNVMTAASIQANIKRGLSRGVIYRDVNYDIHLNTQAVTGLSFTNVGGKVSYGIVQDRVYAAHFPRHIIVGVNLVKRELRLQVKRPAYDSPLLMMMHSQTAVVARGLNAAGTYDGLSKNCAGCSPRIVLSAGDDAVQERTIIDRTNVNTGSNIQAKYFDCEMDISRRNTFRNAIGAFMPYNKNPKTPWTMFVMGMRQIRAFFLYFPRAEKCGAYLRWSQSEENPVREIDVTVQAKTEETGTKLFFRGRKVLLKIKITAKGEPADRNYKINIKYETTPGNLQNNFKLQFGRMGVPAIGMNSYTMCLAVNNKYPDFGEEFFTVDMDQELAVEGDGEVKYGQGSNCAEAQGEINVKFRYSTTQAARDNLRNTWYYQKCHEDKAKPEWATRRGFPVTEACFMMGWDAALARKYVWEAQFSKVTPRMKNFLSKAQTALKAGMLPYWDVDPDALAGSISNDPSMKLDLEFKNNEQAVDVVLKTSQGTSTFNDVPLRLPGWTRRLRSLKYSSTVPRLIKADILNPCIVTSGSVMTMDNITYPYSPASCWTLVSGNCSPKPTYAVFAKKDNKMPLAAKVYFGGNKVEFTPTSAKDVKVTINGQLTTFSENKVEKIHKVGTDEIFKIMRWGTTYHMYSFLNAWVIYDGTFVEVIAAPSTKGQHCGVCGNFDRNPRNEFEDKQGNQISADQMAQAWCK